MDKETRELLSRWESLRSANGLAHATSMTRILWLLGLVLFLGVVIGLYYALYPAVLAAASAVMGWVIAERNALKSRMSQWSIFSRYLDWERVRDDLRDQED